MAATGTKTREARRSRKLMFRGAVGVALLGALAFSVPAFAAGDPTLRSTGTTQMESTPEVVYINSVSDPDQRLVNFNENWKFNLGDVSGANAEVFDDSSWENVNLPHDYSIDQEYTAAGEAESRTTTPSTRSTPLPARPRAATSSAASAGTARASRSAQTSRARPSAWTSTASTWTPRSG